MVEQHAHLVEALRDALLERDELIGEEITQIIVAAEATESGSAETLHFLSP